MSELAWADEYFSGVMALGTHCGVVVSRHAERIVFCSEHVENLTVSAAVALGREMLASSVDRLAERRGANFVVVRRICEVAFGVVAGAAVTESEINRKLNVAAIRAQSQASKEPASALVLQLRAAYIASAGPLSNLVFDRAFEPVRDARKIGDIDALERMMEGLACNVAAAGRQPFRELIRTIFASAIAIGPTPTAPRNVGPPASRPGSAPAARPQTVPQLTAVMDVAREIVGPFSDLLVQRALRSFDATGALDTERFLRALADEIPEVKRERFLAAGRLAVARAPRSRVPSATR